MIRGSKAFTFSVLALSLAGAIHACPASAQTVSERIQADVPLNTAFSRAIVVALAGEGNAYASLSAGGITCKVQGNSFSVQSYRCVLQKGQWAEFKVDAPEYSFYSDETTNAEALFELLHTDETVGEMMASKVLKVKGDNELGCIRPTAKGRAFGLQAACNVTVAK